MTKIKMLNDTDIKELFLEYWEDDFIVVHETRYDANELEGISLVNEQNELLGFATYRLREDCFEIISLNATEKGRGYGSKLIKTLLNKANQANLSVVEVTTTNDNTDALRFYQKFGFTLVKVDFGAVDRARELKPSIPLYDNQIRIEHELTLRLVLGAFR